MLSTASKKLQQAVVNMATEETKGHTVPMKKSILARHKQLLCSSLFIHS
jgi:hypothetical protein